MSVLPAAVARRAAPALGFLHRSEELLAAGALAAMALLPLAEIVVRPIVTGGIPGSIPFVQHLTLWVGFLGAGLAARQNKLIALATATFIPEGISRRIAQAFAATVGAAVSAILAWSAIDVVAIEMEVGGEIALGMPSWVFQLVLPFAFGVIAVRLGWRAGGWGARAVAGGGILIGIWLSGTGAACGLGEDTACVLSGGPGWPWVALVVLAALAGAPIFTILAGAAVFLYMVDAFDPAAVPLYAYDLATEPHLPAIPLFTLAGFILAPGTVVRAAAAGVPGAGRLDAGRHGGGLRRRLRVLHDLHRRLRGHDTRPGWPAAARAAEGRLPRPLLGGPADRLRIARAAAAAGDAAHPVRHRRADRAGESVHRGHPARRAAHRARGRLGDARGHRHRRGPPRLRARR